MAWDSHRNVAGFNQLKASKNSHIMMTRFTDLINLDLII